MSLQIEPQKSDTNHVSVIGGIPLTGSSGQYTEQYTDLRVTSLTDEQHKKTCGYWYVVTCEARSHTAFAEREHLLQWMDDRGLSLHGELALAGTHSIAKIEGTYRRTSHSYYPSFYSLGSTGKRVRILDNGDYTLGIIQFDDDNIANVHHLNCNLCSRLVFDYSSSRKLVG